jgi:hypothetical protein
MNPTKNFRLQLMKPLCAECRLCEFHASRHAQANAKD